MKACPKCRRYSDDAAGSCDCGYSFDSGQVSRVLPDERDRKGWVACNLWSALLGFFGWAVGGGELVARYWWSGLVAAAIAYAASEFVSRQLRYSAFGLRSPGVAQLLLVVAYTVVLVPPALIAFLLSQR